MNPINPVQHGVIDVHGYTPVADRHEPRADNQPSKAVEPNSADIGYRIAQSSRKLNTLHMESLISKMISLAVLSYMRQDFSIAQQLSYQKIEEYKSLQDKARQVLEDSYACQDMQHIDDLC